MRYIKKMEGSVIALILPGAPNIEIAGSGLLSLKPSSICGFKYLNILELFSI